MEWKTDSKKALLDELVIGSGANPAYGLTFWLNHKGKNPRGQLTGRNVTDEISQHGISDAVTDLFMAAGAANQRLYVIRSLDMVVVRQGQLAKYEDAEFLKRLLPGVTGK